MSQIKININRVRDDISILRLNYNNIANIKDGISSLGYRIDSRILARRNIGSRLNSAYNILNDLESKLQAFETFVNEAMDRYERTENKVESEGQAIEDLFYLYTASGISLGLIGDMIMSVEGTIGGLVDGVVEDISEAIEEENTDEEKVDDKKASDDSGVNSKNKNAGISSDNFPAPNDIVHEVFGSALLSGFFGGLDADIGLDISKMVGIGETVSANDITSNLKDLGYNHVFRRNFLRDIEKDARNIEVDIPRVLTWSRDVGALSTGLTAINVGLDIFDNKTWSEKGEASAIDAGATYFASKATPIATKYVSKAVTKTMDFVSKAKDFFEGAASEVEVDGTEVVDSVSSAVTDATVDTVVDVSADVAVDVAVDAAVDVGADVAIGAVAVASAPEVATVAVAVGTAVVVGTAVSWGASKIKSIFNLN